MTAETKAAEIAAKIKSHLTNGGAVQVTSYGRSTVYDGPKQADRFDSRGNAVRVKRGRTMDAILICYEGGTTSGCSIRFGKYS